jgi:flagellar hook assembly protein FlgD
MRIYTVSGELVIKLQPDGTGLITWGGRNSNGSKVSSGVYYYLIKSGSTTLLSGKLLVITDQ